MPLKRAHSFNVHSEPVHEFFDLVSVELEAAGAGGVDVRIPGISTPPGACLAQPRTDELVAAARPQRSKRSGCASGVRSLVSAAALRVETAGSVLKNHVVLRYLSTTEAIDLADRLSALSDRGESDGVWGPDRLDRLPGRGCAPSV